jgi:hypothetical protein
MLLPMPNFACALDSAKLLEAVPTCKMLYPGHPGLFPLQNHSTASAGASLASAAAVILDAPNPLSGALPSILHL